MRLLVVLAVLAAFASAHADLRLPKIFGDHMVLQQKGKAPIWGWATPGQTVVVETGWTNASYKALAGKDGTWKISIPTPAADNRPYDLTVKSGSEFLALHDVVLGEVWVCSGQSNMEWPLAACNQPGEIAMADYPMIRQIKVALTNSPTPLTDIDGAWQVSTPKTSGTFTAVGYYFAKRIHGELNVPVGLINTTWGGTEAELWTSREKLASLPDIKESLKQRERRANAFPILWQSYLRQQQIVDSGYAKFMNTDYDDSAWDAAPSGIWSQNGLGSFFGVAWFRGTFQGNAGAPGVLKLGPVDDMDETWVNGVPVGSINGWNLDRTYNVPAAAMRDGTNVVTVRVTNPIGDGGFDFGRAQVSGTPITGWKMRKGPRADQLPEPPSPGTGGSGLFNAMINPLVGYGIKGALWYQGEANVGRAAQYQSLFPAMITDWRERWGQGTFPFYYVEIAPFTYGAGAASAELRDSQRLTLALPKTGMVVVADAIDTIRDIHPKNKEVPGERLARWALTNDYGFKGIEVSGPLPASTSARGSDLVVRFTHDAGLQAGRKGGTSVGGFQIAGADGKFMPAFARVEGRTVVLNNPSVANPRFARYAWDDAFPTVDQMLYNAAGLPASSFRTDSLPLQTLNNKW